MRWREWMITTAVLLAGLGVAIGGWAYVATGSAPAVPGGYEVWQTLRPGEEWQSFWSYRNGVRLYGAALFVLATALALLHYALIGPDRIPASGRMVARFRRGEVLMHMTLALSFLVLLTSGLYLLWNRLVVGSPIPFWGRLASAAHIWSGLLFLVTLVVVWVRWRHDMRMVAYDWKWLRQAGGYLSREHPRLPAGRFNAGQKIWFRVALLLGILLGLSGLVLYYPGGLGLTPAVQWMLFVAHTAGAAVLIPSVMMHVYLGTLATPGSFTGMVTGRIDENLVRVHHPRVVPIQGAAPATGGDHGYRSTSPSTISIEPRTATQSAT